MPVSNPKANRRLSKTTAPHACSGCGAMLPKGSMVLIWSIWSKGMRNRYRFCSGCQSVIYDCKERRPMDVQHDYWLVRDICESCDGYLTCPRVQYMKDTPPGEVTFADLPKGT